MNCFPAAPDRGGGRLRRGLSVVGGKGVGSGAAGLAAAGSGMERSEGWRKLHLNDRRSARLALSADNHSLIGAAAFHLLSNSYAARTRCKSRPRLRLSGRTPTHPTRRTLVASTARISALSCATQATQRSRPSVSVPLVCR